MTCIEIIGLGTAVLLHLLWGVLCYRSLRRECPFYTVCKTFLIATFNALPIIIFLSMLHSATKGQKP